MTKNLDDIRPTHKPSKNWLTGISGPNGQHLVELIQHSDHVLQVMLILVGRYQ